MLLSLTHPVGMGQCTAELDRYLENANDKEVKSAVLCSGIERERLKVLG